MTDKFWEEIDRVLNEIEAEKPNTYEGVKAILDTHDPREDSDSAFFGGSGGDRALSVSLEAAGWLPIWMEANYFYCARHPETEERLTYIEGDVLRGDLRPLPEGKKDGEQR